MPMPRYTREQKRVVRTLILAGVMLIMLPDKHVFEYIDIRWDPSEKGHVKSSHIERARKVMGIKLSTVDK